MSLRSMIALLRPNQWIKNIVIFGALIFAREFTDWVNVSRAFYAFVIFCLLSSTIYIVNDIIDRDTDRSHPLKKGRPLAAGAISPPTAWVMAAVIGAIGLALTSTMPRPVIYTALVFLAFNALYSLVLKKIVIIDVRAVAVSFVIRAVAGSFAIAVPNSSWLVACAFLLALFIGFGKRRHETVTLGEDAGSHRVSLKKYSPYFLDQLIGVVTASTVVAYTFYTLSPEIKQKLGVSHLELTIPFVLYGVFRYLYLIHQEEKGGSPTEVLLSDIPILINIVLWFLSVMAIFVVSGN